MRVWTFTNRGPVLSGGARQQDTPGSHALRGFAVEGKAAGQREATCPSRNWPELCRVLEGLAQQQALRHTGSCIPEADDRDSRLCAGKGHEAACCNGRCYQAAQINTPHACRIGSNIRHQVPCEHPHICLLAKALCAREGAVAIVIGVPLVCWHAQVLCTGCTQGPAAFSSAAVEYPLRRMDSTEGEQGLQEITSKPAIGM